MKVTESYDDCLHREFPSLRRVNVDPGFPRAIRSERYGFRNVPTLYRASGCSVVADGSAGRGRAYRLAICRSGHREDVAVADKRVDVPLYDDEPRVLCLAKRDTRDSNRRQVLDRWDGWCDGCSLGLFRLVAVVLEGANQSSSNCCRRRDPSNHDRLITA
jgi:hypothetical protein